MFKQVKSFWGIVAVLLILAGCQDETLVNNGSLQGPEFTLTASKGVMSRTHLASDGKQTLWSEGDRIYVSSADGSVYGYLTLVEDDANKNVGTFKGTLQGEGDLDSNSLVYAVYPTPRQKWNEDYTSYSLYCDISSVNGGDKLNAPMIGQIANHNAVFENTCGILRLNLQNANNATGKSFKISAKSGEEAVKFLTTATVNVDENGVVSMAYSANENADGTITLNNAVGGFMYIPYAVDQDATVYVDGIEVATVEAAKVKGVLKQNNVKTLTYSETTSSLIEPAKVEINNNNVSGNTLSLQVSSATVEPGEGGTQAAAHEFVNIPSITEALTDGSEGAVVPVSEVVVELPKIEEASTATASVVSFEEIPQNVTVTIKEDETTTENKSIENLTVILPSTTTEDEAKEAIEINMPNTTVTIKTTDGNIIYIKNMVAETFDETLVLDQSVEITSLTILKGSVQVFGKIGELKRDADNADELTKVTIEVGGSVDQIVGEGFEVYNKNLPEPNVIEVAQMLYQSIYEAQQDPMVAERIPVYNWSSAAGINGEQSSFLGAGRYNDSYIADYYYPYMKRWISNANSAITSAQENAPGMLNKHTKNFNQNLYSFARIWRAVMIAEYSDNFGPYPLTGLDAENPQYNSVKEVYYYILDELKAAVEGIIFTEAATSEEAALDPIFGYNPEKWAKYANSLRLRFAMRLSQVDAAKAQAEFEAVDKNMLITNMYDIAKVKERNTWDALAGIYSRSWNYVTLPSTMSNILTGLGGVAVSEQRADLAEYTKPMNYMGLQFVDHYAECTDNPTKGYWLDGIPENLDPRALRLYCLPNDQNADNFKDYGSINNHANYGMMNDNGEIIVNINASHTWNYYPYGSRKTWSPKFGKNAISAAYPYVLPVLSRTYGGDSEGERVWFGPWETHFLLAEASLYGWSTGTTAQAAYEQGIRTSFENFGVSQYVDEYLASEDYNRVGVSVKFTHTAEPTSFTANYVNGYTSEEGTFTYEYPNAGKSLYKEGLNTQLAKIITQKYIAQAPYCALEMWNDRRRLGLPWFDMPNNETTLVGTDMENTWIPETYLSGQNTSVFPQRLRYPNNMNNLDGALQTLGGENTVLTPLWWALTVN
jgi:hypothetical protein